MTTMTPPVPAQPASPEAAPSLASMLYGSDADPVAAPPEAPAETAETDPSPEAEKAEATSPPADSQTTEEPTPGTEAPDTAKQLADQRTANKRLGREMAELREAQAKLAEDNRILVAKLKGEYEEPAKPTPEQAADEARFQERERISRTVAMQLYGEETMEKRVYANGSDLETIIIDEMKSNPGKISPTKLAILLDEQPAVRAMQELQTRDFKAKHGDDPTKWEEKIIAAAKPKLLAELKKSLAATNTGSQPPSVTGGRAAGGGPTTREKSTAEILYGGKS